MDNKRKKLNYSKYQIIGAIEVYEGKIIYLGGLSKTVFKNTFYKREEDALKAFKQIIKTYTRNKPKSNTHLELCGEDFDSNKLKYVCYDEKSNRTYLTTYILNNKKIRNSRKEGYGLCLLK